MDEPLLVLGNKNLSSWSLRAWIGLALTGVSFRERVIRLDQPGTAAEIAAVSPAGRVPVLVVGELVVHESLAVLEYVNEAYAEGALWPAAPQARARARAVSAEMHAGFPHIREHLPMNLARPYGPPAPAWAPDAPTQGELTRVRELWEGLLTASGGPFLFGAWSIADCMYLPVATRLRTYAIDMTTHPRAAAYAARLLALPAFRRWEAEALAEPEVHAHDER